MENGETNKTDTQRNEANPISETNPSPIENQKKTYEEIKAINDKVEVEMIRAEQLRAKIAQGGQTMAGQENKQKTQDDIDQEEANKLLADED